MRCFEDDNVIHVDGSVNAARDIEVINLELIFSDIEVLDRRILKTEKDYKGGNRSLGDELDLLNRLKAHLESGKSARAFECADDAEREIVASVPLLSGKLVIYAANMSENDFANGVENNKNLKAVEEIAAAEHSAYCGAVRFLAASQRDFVAVVPLAQGCAHDHALDLPRHACNFLKLGIQRSGSLHHIPCDIHKR